MSVEHGLAQLRALQPEHRDRVREIVKSTGVFRDEEVDIALEVFDSATEAPGTDYTPLGAFDGDQLLGYACYGHTPCTVATWDLYWIAVDPAYYRLGVGRQLLQACEEGIAARGGRLVVAETSSRPDYDATRAFYETMGYQAAARVGDFYAPGDDLVVYTKRVGPQ